MRARVLIVEDEIILAKNLQMKLTHLNYEVVAIASSGEDAVQQAVEIRPDIVLMDIMLAGEIDGITAAGRINDQLDVPIIYLTSFVSGNVIERVKLTQPFGYILKPFEERELQIVMEVAVYRHQLEQKLKENERWQATLLRSIGDGVTATDSAGCLNFINRVTEQLTGWTLEEVQGKQLSDIFQLLHEETRDPLENPVTTATKAGTTTNLTNALLIIKNGTEISIEGSCAPIKDEKDHIFGAVLAFKDVTERKRAEAALRRSQEQVRQLQKIEAMGRLASGVAHDFNNLLTSVIGYSELASMQLENDDVLREDLFELQSAAQQAISVTKLANSELITKLLGNSNSMHEDLLELRKTAEQAISVTQQLLTLERKTASQPKILDFNSLTKDTVKMLERMVGYNAEFILTLDPHIKRIKGDFNQLQQVILNLVKFSCLSMPQGGKLIINTSSVEVKKSYAAQRLSVPPGQYVTLTISDTSKGIEAEKLSHLFDPLYSDKESDNNRGLGLATVNAIIQQMGGNIQVKSELKVGTTFKIYLPSVDAPVELATSTPVSKEMSGPETILLVDDNEGVRSVVRRFLQKSGYSVLEATSADEALQLCRQYQGSIHLLLVDIMMPEMVGTQLVERLQLIRPESRVIYMSGYPHDTVDRYGVFNPGINFIYKPFTFDSLTQKVREVLKVLD